MKGALPSSPGPPLAREGGGRWVGQYENAGVGRVGTHRRPGRREILPPPQAHGTFCSLATSSASTCRSRRRQSTMVPTAARATIRSVKPAVSQPRRRIGSSTSLASTLAITYQSVSGTGAMAAMTGTPR